jgi:hypothetical protein
MPQAAAGRGTQQQHTSCTLKRPFHASPNKTRKPMSGHLYHQMMLPARRSFSPETLAWQSPGAAALIAAICGANGAPQVAF